MGKKDSIAEDWTNESRVFWTGKHLRFDHDSQIPQIVVGVDDLMDCIANSRGKQFHVGKGPRGTMGLRMSKVAQALADSARHLNPHLVRRYNTRHQFSPYFDMWERIWQDALTLAEVIRRPDSVDRINEWFDNVRTELRASPFRKAVHNQRRVARKNAASLKSHINRLFSRHSRLLVIRIDFGYRHEPEFDAEPWVPPADKDVKADFAKLKRFIRKNIPHLKSIIWKIEYGAIKGHHLHGIFISDGHLVREGISWGKVIGEQWEAITSGAGSYWNCNANEALFEKMGRRGIGLINYDDKARRASLIRVAMYVAKSDCYARFISPDIGRTFGKSNCNPVQSARGRPRKNEGPAKDPDMKPNKAA